MCYKSTRPARSPGLSDGGIIELRTSPDDGLHWQMRGIQVFSPVEDQDSRSYHPLLAGASSRPRWGCAAFGTCINRGRCSCVGEGQRSPLLPTLFRNLRLCAGNRPRSRRSRDQSHGDGASAWNALNEHFDDQNQEARCACHNELFNVRHKAGGDPIDFFTKGGTSNFASRCWGRRYPTGFTRTSC